MDKLIREVIAIERALQNGAVSLITRPPAQLEVLPHLPQIMSFLYAT